MSVTWHSLLEEGDTCRLLVFRQPTDLLPRFDNTRDSCILHISYHGDSENYFGYGTVDWSFGREILWYSHPRVEVIRQAIRTPVAFPQLEIALTLGPSRFVNRTDIRQQQNFHHTLSTKNLVNCKCIHSKRHISRSQL